MTVPWIVAFAALWLVVLIVGALLVGTLHRVIPVLVEAESAMERARRMARVGGIEVGSIVPPFSVDTVDHSLLTDDDLRGTTSVVLFIGNECPACDELNRSLEAGDVPEIDARLVVVASDNSHGMRLSRSRVPVVADADRVVTASFGSDRTPHAFVIDPAGRVVGVGSPNGWSGVRELVEISKKGGEEAEHVSAAVAVGSHA